MACYRRGSGCGPYEAYSCGECPASHPEYAERYKARPASAPDVQKEDQFLEINGQRFSYEALAAQLGFSKIETLKLCQKVQSGTLTAFSSGDEYPGIDVELVRPDDNVPSAIARVEQPVGEEDDPEPLRAFLYDGRDTYIAYTVPDIRPDKESEADPRPIKLVASGDPDQRVDVYSENPYVCYKGDLL